MTTLFLLSNMLKMQCTEGGDIEQFGAEERNKREVQICSVLIFRPAATEKFLKANGLRTFSFAACICNMVLTSARAYT